MEKLSSTPSLPPYLLGRTLVAVVTILPLLPAAFLSSARWPVADARSTTMMTADAH